jgi:hypothetical protein
MHVYITCRDDENTCKFSGNDENTCKFSGTK